ncbi:MAG: hypothetical protein ACLP3K_11380 [Candidatus Acidiferrales bacterium]
MDPNKYVEKIALAVEREKKVGFADIRIGDIKVRGITVWRSGNGQLRVYFPRYRPEHRMFVDCVDVPPEMRSEIKAEIIAAYRAKKRESEQAESAKRAVPTVK